ncbi:hypothetical protein [Candidatus Leptofilum sp.]|uniref:hypothetical protein n=1 Tax=Candidatus Leptofilum sp. TaxID=3241576 RepID=UPI003B597099
METTITPDEIFFYCHAPFDTGIILATVTTNKPEDLQAEAENAASIMRAETKMNWEIEKSITIVSADDEEFSFGGYNSPLAIGFLQVDILDQLSNKKLKFNHPAIGDIECEIDSANLYIHRFRTGIVNFRVKIPEAIWLDIPALSVLRNSLQTKTNFQAIFDPILIEIVNTLKQKLGDLSSPEFPSETFDFGITANLENPMYWSHSILCAYTPSDQVKKTGEFLSQALRKQNPGHIENFAPPRANVFCFTDAGNSLVCVPSRHSEIEVKSWTRLIEIENYIYKVIWDLDHMLYMELTNISASVRKNNNLNQDLIRNRIHQLKRLSILLEILIDDFAPRHLTVDFGRMHYLDLIFERWRMKNLLDDVRKKFEVLEELNQYIISRIQESSQQNLNRVLVLITVLTIVSVMTDSLALIEQIRSGSSDIINTVLLMLASLAIVLGLIFLVPYIRRRFNKID